MQERQGARMKKPGEQTDAPGFSFRQPGERYFVVMIKTPFQSSGGGAS